jgi:hypothetical protein
MSSSELSALFLLQVLSEHKERSKTQGQQHSTEGNDDVAP